MYKRVSDVEIRDSTITEIQYSLFPEGTNVLARKITKPAPITRVAPTTKLVPTTKLNSPAQPSPTPKLVRTTSPKLATTSALAGTSTLVTASAISKPPVTSVSRSSSSLATTPAVTTTSALPVCSIRNQRRVVKKRAFITRDKAPPTLPVTIEGKTFGLTKNDDQGNNAVVYKVTSGSDIGSFAKTPLTKSLQREAIFTETVGQLIAFGVDPCREFEFMIVQAAPGATLPKIQKFVTAKENGRTECLAVVRQAVDVAVAKARSVFAEKEINHGDINPGNVLFDDEIQEATLIDWGSATTRPINSIAEGQALFEFNKLCVGAAPDPEGSS
ncbi:hypothetical protein BD410DRAFT_842037 [Rickenella mellea]|uniref:Aminoglycoside phosphotransferase domain-containing protein n=1 Tax=Rickenella mellea TaxID=50990 RepID=A0A4Y7PWT8_9AGAM|nr:hypothetical protein BD410DRAFT_842037 [Rickenella mellea]